VTLDTFENRARETDKRLTEEERTAKRRA
jgi:hypothetical protein